MKRLLAKSNLLVIASAVLYPIIFIHELSLLAWIYLIPFVYSVAHLNHKASFKAGFFYGTVLCIASFYWLPDVIANFVGGAYIWGLLLSLVAVLIGALFFGCILFFYGLLKKEKYPPWVNAVLLAAIWALSERLFAFAFEGMPWLGFQMGNLLVSNLYFIQPAEWGGLYLLSFAVVFINVWSGLLLAKSTPKQIWKPVVCLVCYVGLCLLLFQHATKLEEHQGIPTISVAMMCENTAPEEKWNNNNGPQMVKNLLALNQQAAALKPDVVLWTESAVPWTYKADDAFVLEVLKNAQRTNTIQIVGMNSTYDSNSVYNSAYCIMPDGKVAGRYDKRFLLSLAEKPLSFFKLPFLNSTDGFYAKEGTSSMPLPTPKGQIGVLICNEAFIPAASVDMVRNGADYLVNISNDGWFSEIPFMKAFHFNSARLRAVEVRRDIAVNSNLGISGEINSSGITENSKESTEGFVEKVTLKKNTYISVFSEYPNFSLTVLCLFVIIFIVLRFFIRK